MIISILCTNVIETKLRIKSQTRPKEKLKVGSDLKKTLKKTFKNQNKKLPGTFMYNYLHVCPIFIKKSHSLYRKKS